MTAWQARVAALEALFEQVAATRMQGVPILHPTLRVQAVGFEPDEATQGGFGILVTPWFMNLIHLPAANAPDPTPVGEFRRRCVGQTAFDFIGAHEAGFGAYEACSLFSPMYEFQDQAAAVATAQAVLLSLRSVEPAAPPPMPSRRAWLLGRGGGAGERGA